MSFKRNIIVTYTTQIYTTVIGILILPMYLKYMGAEAYGLVGFFTMLQAWFGLLDMGLTPTVARETARFRGGATDALSYRRLLRALQIVFSAIALIGGVVLLACSDLIAKHWLNSKALPIEQVKISLQLIAVSVALRWMSGLYRGCISGSERLVWLGGFNAFVASIRFVGVLPVLIWWGSSPEVFFFYQLGVAVIELAGLVAKSQSLFPVLRSGELLSWSPSAIFRPIAPVLRFSLTIAFTSSVWVLVTQTDKLVLSKILPLAEYGYFTLAVLAASGVMMISGPVSGALMPRMARLQAEDDHRNLIALYRNATQMVAVIAVPASVVLAIFSEHVLLLWTGDVDISVRAGPLLRLYALGNGFLAMSAFAYYLQFAYGNLRLHLIGSALFATLLIPLLVWSTYRYGAMGAGYSWLAVNAIYFFIWLPIVHRKFAVGLQKRWMLQDVIPIALGASFSAVIFSAIFQSTKFASHALVSLVLSSLGALLFAGLCSSFVRQRVGRRFLKRSCNAS